jgi:hypothetical protein
MPTKRLPSRPNLDQLKHQAKDLVADHRAGTLQACQRIREFHPPTRRWDRPLYNAATFALGDAQLTIAREYGFASWARLSTFVREASPSDLERPHHERIADRRFRQAVQLLDDGDVDELHRLLADMPSLANQRSTSKAATTSGIHHCWSSLPRTLCVMTASRPISLTLHARFWRRAHDPIRPVDLASCRLSVWRANAASRLPL